jgi:hypothetical protein
MILLRGVTIRNPDARLMDAHHLFHDAGAFFIRPPLRLTRSLNHRASADCGWWRSHSQAICVRVVRNRGFPALETPCSRSTDPLC